MKNLWVAVAMTLSLVFVASLGYLGYRLVSAGMALDADSEAYSRKVILEVGRDWSLDTVLAHADDDLKKNVNPKQTGTLMRRFSKKLGPVEEIKSIRGEAKIFFQALTLSRNVTAGYDAQVAYQKAEGNILVALKLVDGVWKLSGLRVNSPMLAEE